MQEHTELQNVEIPEAIRGDGEGSTWDQIREHVEKRLQEYFDCPLLVFGDDGYVWVDMATEQHTLGHCEVGPTHWSYNTESEFYEKLYRGAR